MKEYFRTKEEIICKDDCYIQEKLNGSPYVNKESLKVYYKEDIIKKSINLLDLILVGDIIFYWVQSDDTIKCEIVQNEFDIRRLFGFPITRVLAPTATGFRDILKGEPEFDVIDGRRYLKKSDNKLNVVVW